ncbi:MAG: 4Fe-4S cluster-binding domain-containing protein [Firmicutes bacterium]|nr:4Fe-4S cluster-binding domain-containing protein [Bacillota bacterium]
MQNDKQSKADNATHYEVIEIFDSLDGEGVRTGQAVTFVRLAQCNLRCDYCDTKYSYDGSRQPVPMRAQDIVAKCNAVYKRVTLTGGEPMMAKGVDALILEMTRQGFEVNVETNGAVDLRPLLTKRDKENLPLFFSVDYKLPSSKMQDKMIEPHFAALGKKDIVKFVVGSKQDVQVMCQKIKEHKLDACTQIFVGAVFEKFALHDLAQEILQNPVLHNARLQIQLHKVIGIQ